MKVIICSCGTKAKTVNPLGEKPDMYNCETFKSDACNVRFICCQDEWKYAESERKEYEICEEWFAENVKEALQDGILRLDKVNKSLMKFIYKPNTEHEAELLPNGKIRIL